MSDYQERKDYFKIYRQNNKDKINEHYKNNKVKINERSKIYRQNNKDKINEIIKCSCGSEITKQHLLRHLKTKKHLSTI